MPIDNTGDDDLPLPPPPIDAAFEEESRQYQEFLRREEKRSSLKGGETITLVLCLSDTYWPFVALVVTYFANLITWLQ
jgi:hypothetical protein